MQELKLQEQELQEQEGLEKQEKQEMHLHVQGRAPPSPLSVFCSAARTSLLRLLAVGLAVA